MENPAIVVAATCDYIELIDQKFPGLALFLTDRSERAKFPDDAPAQQNEVLFDGSDHFEAVRLLRLHLTKHDIRPAGLTAYDCEALPLAAYTALELGLDFPTPEAVTACRDKGLSKSLMSAAGVFCPRSVSTNNPQAVRSFIMETGGPVIVKPVNSTGSQGVFLLGRDDDPEQVMGLVAAWNEGGLAHPAWAVAEEWIDGPEYSCDFMMDNREIRLIRLAKKRISPELGPGTATGYLVVRPDRSGLDLKTLKKDLLNACSALGLKRTLGMADFIIYNRRPCFIEITPRAGGDCLPWVLTAANGADTIGMSLDFARSKIINLPGLDSFRPAAGLRLMAKSQGAISKLSADKITCDPKVVSTKFFKQPGDRVVLPPLDYQSRILGQVIFMPQNPGRFEEECLELENRLELEIGEDIESPGPTG